MEFLGMLLINVFLGVIFYLIITLKLEKSASDFREKKLWEEMDKMIQEFNATAERNISILEKKIRIMRALLDKSGDLKKIDFTIEDDDEDESVARETETAAAEESPPLKAAVSSGRPEMIGRGPVPNRYASRKLWPLLKEAFFSILDGIGDYLNGIRERNASRAARNEEQSVGAFTGDIPARGPVSGAGVIEKDFVEIESKISSQLEAERKPEGPSEDDIMMIIGDGKDKRSTISLLHRKGCPEEEISHYMGIPLGEVRLILNLTDSI